MSRPRTPGRRRPKATGDLARSGRRPSTPAASPREPSSSSEPAPAQDQPTATSGERPDPGKPKIVRRINLAAEARANPFLFFTSEETGAMFGLGENVMTALRSMGAPVVGRKMNPVLLMEWLKQNHERVPKVRGDEE